MARFTHWIGWLRAVSIRMAAVSRRLLPIALVACLSSAAPGAAQCTLPGLADPPRMPGVPFEDLSLRATEAWEAGRGEEAVRYFRAGVELNPLWHDGWWRLGLTLSEAGCHEAARDALRRVVQLKPGAGPGWTLLGASALGPEVRDVYVALAQAYARAGRTADVERTRATLQRLDAVQGAGR